MADKNRRSPYQWSPTLIAFLNGAIMSAAINILTGVNDYDPPKKWIALGISIAMLLGSILLIVWQNIATKLQETYPQWEKIVIKNNKDYGMQTDTSWNTFIRKIDEANKNKTESDDFEYPRYGKLLRLGLLLAIAALLIVSVGTLVYIVI